MKSKLSFQIASESQQKENMNKIKIWCNRHYESVIKVDVITQFGEREQTVKRANGKIRLMEEHPNNKGVYVLEFDSHLWEDPGFDYIMLGYEIIDVQEKGEKLTIHKLNQQIVLHAQV